MTNISCQKKNMTNIFNISEYIIKNKGPKKISQIYSIIIFLTHY